MARGVNPPPNNTASDQNGLTTSRSSGDSMNSRRNGLSLPLNNTLAIPLYNSPPPPLSREDVQEGGQILFQNFLREEFQQQGVESPPLVEQLFSASGDSTDYSVHQPNGAGTSAHFRGAEAYAGIRFTNSPTAVRTPEGYKTLDWTRMGRNIRDIADQFARSKEGAAVRHQAEQVELNDINQDRFFDLLVELFSGGFTAERVVALFYFCTTLIIRAATRNRLDLTRYLFTWSLRYIRDRVCQWVYEHGGWENVLSNLYPILLKFGIITFVTIAIGCGIVYIRKNL